MIQERMIYMDEDEIMEGMVQLLEANGELRAAGDGEEITVQSVDDKEGYSYVSNTHVEFDTSIDAVEWIIEQFNGAENIEEWE
jgi:hypothetical protein